MQYLLNKLEKKIFMIKYFWCHLYYFIDIEAECQDDYMKIRIGFNGSFSGLLYSSGK